MSLFSFLYNTMQPRVSDPNNKKFYLPNVLSGIDNPNKQQGGKLLPPRDLNWNLGEITGPEANTISGPIARWYGTYLTTQEKVPNAIGVVDPAHPNPSLSLSSVVVNGLENCSALGSPQVQSGSDGYKAVITLKFNSYPGLPGFTIDGNFLLSQGVANLNNPNKPNDPASYDHRKVIDGTGDFQVNFTEILIDAAIAITVNGTGTDRSLALTITSLTLRGNKPGSAPQVSVKILKINSAPPGLESVWVRLSENAFNSADGKKSMLNNLSATLNQPSNLNSLSGTLTSQLGVVLNSFLGAVPAGGLPVDSGQGVPNPADLYFFDRIRVSLDNPSSDWYLPRVLCSSGSPSLEPYAISSINIGSQNIAGLTWDPNTLSGVVLNGISNNILPSGNMQLKNGVMYLDTLQGQLNPPPSFPCSKGTIPAPPLTLTGSFSLQPPMMDAITGSFVVRVTNSSLHIEASATGDNLDHLVITVQKMQLQANTSNIGITFTFPPGSGLDGMVTQIANSSSVKTSILEKINTELGNNLGSISSSVTSAAKSGIASRLDN